MPTYRQLYEEHLDKLASDGGPDEVVTAVVEEINALGQPGYVQDRKFAAWVSRVTLLRCSVCEQPFQIVQTPSISEETVCSRCAAE